MDFPISVPGIGLVDGKFIDEDALSGTPGSLIPSVWGNSITLEILNVIEGAGLTPDEDNNTQLLQAINSFLLEATPEATETVLGLIRRATQAELGEGSNDTAAVSPKKLAAAVQNQTLTAFTTAGAAPAFTLTPSPAIDAYATSQRFSVKFNAAAPTGGTLDVSGKGPKNLKQYDSTGAKIATVIGANQITDVVYDGTDFIVLDPLPVGAGNLIGTQGAASNIAGVCTGANAVVTITADELTLKNSANAYQVVRSVNISPTFANAGVNGLDVGAANSQTASTWYYVHVIWNGTTIAGLLSLSRTAPTLPAGYTHSACVWEVRTDATANKYPLATKKAKGLTRYTVGGANVPTMPLMATGTAGNTTTPTWVAVAVGAFVPPTAVKISVAAQGGRSTTAVAIAPNNQYGSLASLTNPPPISLGCGSGADYMVGIASGDILLESSNIYWASVVSALFCHGWESNL